MRISHSIESFAGSKNVVLTTGTFDGVHKGHRVIIDRLCRIARQIDGESVLLTFDPHPRKVIHPNEPISLLSTVEEKVDLLAKTGLDHLVIHPFTLEFSRTTSRDFIQKLLVEQLRVKRLVIGYDHHFGRNREGSFEHLLAYGSNYGFEVEEIPVQEVEQVAVSSTKIRNAISNAEVEKAREWLGYSYFISGFVKQGRGIGRTIEFPTANINPSSPSKLIPGNGVYLVKVEILDTNEDFWGMCNIGVNPTVGGSERSVEVHVFDFSGNLYNRQLRVSFLQKLRNEIKFNSLDSLKNQLNEDAEISKSLISGYSL